MNRATPDQVFFALFTLGLHFYNISVHGSLRFVPFWSLVLLAPAAMAQCNCDGYEKVQLVMQYEKGKGTHERSLLTNRAGKVLFVVRGNAEDSVGLLIGGRLQKNWRIQTTDDASAYAANSIDIALKGDQDITVVNHDKKQYACFRTTDKFRIVNVFVSQRTWWLTKTNLTIVLE